jgi:hypothetical protein
MRVCESILNIPYQPQEARKTLKPFQVANKIKLEPEVFEKIKQAFRAG